MEEQNAVVKLSCCSSAAFPVQTDGNLESSKPVLHPVHQIQHRQGKLGIVTIFSVESVEGIGYLVHPDVSGFQAPCLFNEEIVLRQLRYTGMLATVKIRQSGYNYRLTFEVRAVFYSKKS